MGQPTYTTSQAITFAVVATLASRQLEKFASMMDPDDEILICHSDEVRESELIVPAACEKATNPWVLVLQSYEDISSEQLLRLRTGLPSAELSHYQVPVEVPRSAGQDSWQRLERRIFARDYRGHRLNILKSFRISAPPLLKADAPLALNHRLCAALEWVDREPESAVAWVSLAGLYAVQRNWVKAESAARHAVLRAVGVEALDASQLLSLALLRQGKVRQVVEHGRTERQLGIRSLLSFYWLSLAHRSMGNMGQALATIDECIDRTWDDALSGDPTIATTYRFVERAQLLVKLQRYEEAQEQLLTLPEEALAHKRVALVQATANCGLGEYAEALGVLTPWLRDGDTDASVARLAADLFAHLDQHRAAADYYEIAWKQGGTDDDLYDRWLAVSEALGDTGRVHAAYSACATATEVSPELLKSWARGFEEAGDIEKAHTCYTEALARSPLDSGLYFELGRLLAKSGQALDAVHIFEAGLRLDPDNLDAIRAHQEASDRVGLSAKSESLDPSQSSARAA